MRGEGITAPDGKGVVPMWGTVRGPKGAEGVGRPGVLGWVQDKPQACPGEQGLGWPSWVWAAMGAGAGLSRRQLAELGGQGRGLSPCLSIRAPEPSDQQQLCGSEDMRGE